MNEQDLIALLQQAFPDAQVSVSLNGGHVDISVTSSVFVGLRPVARQQLVYAPLASLIADGTLHAVNISVQTP
ncbi:MAG: BolA family transcriptional regulator [Halieaceae bacterium]|nr:BolA family transcriptional regulator [Halieaceae bacterium]